MKLQRFFGNYNLNARQVVIADQELVKQIRSVLRLSAGDQVLLCDGNGQEALGNIERISGEEVTVNVEKVMENAAEPTRHVVLYCAVLKRENFELVCQKATEIGVKEIVPIITKRTVKLNLNSERAQKIMKEAAEQSGRGIVPVLYEPMDVEKAIEHAKKNSVNVFFDSSGEILDSRFQFPDSVGVWIGPEGGWDQTEIDKALSSKFQVSSLGKLTLRGETAAIVAAYLAVS